MSARDVIKDCSTVVNVCSDGNSDSGKVADGILAMLERCGYRILARGELDPATIEKCREVIIKANEKLPGIETPKMGGDNLAVCLCSFFDDGGPDDDETGWSEAATDGYNETIKAIRDHYSEAIRSLSPTEG